MFADAVRRLTAPGAEFETVTDPDTHLCRFAGTPRTLRDLLLQADPRKQLLWHDGRWWTVGEVADAAAELGTRLVEAHGVRPGDRVAILGHNSPAWVVAFFAATGVGAVAVPLNAWWSTDELSWALHHAGAAVVVADRSLAQRIQVDAPVVVVDPAPGDEPRTGSWPAHCPLPTDLATILYTSGSSGTPKGVVSTNDSILQAVWAFACRAAVEGGEDHEGPAVVTRTLLPVPLFHVTGCVGVLLGALRSGGEVVLMGRWDPVVALRLVGDLRITHVVGVPTQWGDLLGALDATPADVSTLVRIGGGGAPAPPSLVRRLASVLGAGGVGIGYGMTETNGYGPVNSGADYLANPDSSGRLVPIAEVEARDPDGRPVPPGAEGQIWFRGPHLASGYWHDDETRAETWSEGWLRTGDLGTVDADGQVRVTGRLKEMILRGGENVAVAEVEAALFEHPAVREVAVLGVPDDRMGEAVAAVVVGRAGQALGSDELVEWLRGRIAGYKVPTRVRWSTESLPRTASGKIARARLRELLTEP
ncbi:class I adenylate-forming enzyme family protein [Nocardioides sp.]|uniref:class I adenylate-forming enzyme family protein n=1 Tax=Nocardioides sp. TaxID=35761 RepID=UPI003784A9EE